MHLRSLHPLFAAELIGADLTLAPSQRLIDTVECAMAKYGVLVIRDARIDDRQHKQFSRAFGPLELPSRPAGVLPPSGKRRIDPDMF